MEIITKDTKVKTYCSNKNNVEQYFEVMYNIKSTSKDLTVIDLTIDVEVNYLFQVDVTQNHLSSHSMMDKNVMRFYLSNEVFTVDDIVLSVKSMGIGTVILKDIFKLAKNYIPLKSVYFKMFIGDEEDEVNKIRRDRFYEKFGLKKSNGAYRIDTIKNIDTKNINTIADEVDLKAIIQERSDMKNELNECHKTNKRILTSNTSLREENSNLYNKNMKLLLWLVLLGWLMIICFLVLD